MAASIALNSSVNIDATPDAGVKGFGGLFNRVKAVGEKLRNAKREDMAWMTGNIVIGAAASKLAVGAVGLTLSAAIGTAALASVGSIVAVGAASAVMGGLASGTVRSLSSHIRERMNVERETPRSFAEVLKQESQALFHIKDFRKQINQSTKSALLGAGLMGTFHLASAFLEHTEMGRELAVSAKETFQKVAQNQGAFWKSFGKTLHAKLPLSGAHAMTADDMPRAMKTIPAAASAPVAAPDNDMPRAMGKAPAPVAAPTPAAPIIAPAADAAQDNVPKAMGKAAVVAPDNDMPRAMGKASAPAPVADITPPAPAAPIEPTVQAAQPKTELPTKSSVGQHPTLDGGVRERALAWARAMNPLKAAVPDVPTSAPSAPLPNPVADNVPKPMVSAPIAPLAGAQPPATTLHERAMAWAQKMNPMPQPPVSADKIVDLADLAKTDLNGVASEHIVVRTDAGVEVRLPADPNFKAELETANAAIQAENARNVASGLPSEADLAPEKMAGACVADIPATQADLHAQSKTLPTNCAVVPDKLTMNEGDYVTIRDGKGGFIRAAFAEVAQRTSGFMAKVVPLEVTDMMREKLAAAPSAP